MKGSEERGKRESLTCMTSDECMGFVGGCMSLPTILASNVCMLSYVLLFHACVDVCVCGMTKKIHTIVTRQPSIRRIRGRRVTGSRRRTRTTVVGK